MVNHYLGGRYMRKGFMFIDETIKLDFEIPEDLKEYIDGMDKAFEENDEMSWDFYHEVIGEFAKNVHNEGLITSEQMHAIWERYGTAG